MLKHRNFGSRDQTGRRRTLMDKKTAANNNVVVELDKIRQYDNKGAHGTRGRYLEGCKRSFRIIDSKFKIQKVENLQGKHLQYLVDEMIRSGYAPATIRTELSALRTTYAKAGGRGRLPSNKQLGVPKGERGKEDRAWSSEEIAKAIDLADKMGRVDVLFALHGGAAYGFRINEVCTIRVEDVEKALTTNQLKVTGKGGKVRAVPDKTEYQKLVIKMYYEYAHNNHLQKGDYIISENKYRGVELQKKSIQSWIYNHREKFMDKDRAAYVEAGKKPKTSTISFHGLRYDFAQDLKKRLEEEGVKNVAKEVSQSLGHNRSEATQNYLSEIPKKRSRKKK